MKMTKASDGDEVAVGQHGTSLLGFGQWKARGLSGQGDVVARKIEATEQLADHRHDHVSDQRIDNLAECSADDHADSEIHHVALEGKLLELLHHSHEILLLLRKVRCFRYCRWNSRTEHICITCP